MKPRVDLTISRFAEERKTRRVETISLSIFAGIVSITEKGCQWGFAGSVLITVPLNSNTSLDMAVTVALIMWGVAPARPAATIVMYSSRLALTGLRV